ncbi:MAG: hypothetical protein FWD73_12415 [Polyangiaceae bacterium]|nr:hypothetical protein [Polyangiaceae bacterium]
MTNMKASLMSERIEGTSPYRLPSGLNERVEEKLAHVRQLRNRYAPVRCAVVPAPLVGEIANLVNRVHTVVPSDEQEFQSWEEAIAQLSSKLGEVDRAVQKARETVPLPQCPPEPEFPWFFPISAFGQREGPLAVGNLVVESLASRKDAVITTWGYTEGVCARFRERDVDLLLAAYGHGPSTFLVATSGRVTCRLRASIPSGITLFVQRLAALDMLGRTFKWLGKALGSASLSGDAAFDRACQVDGNPGIAAALLTDSVRQLLLMHPIEQLVIANGTVEVVWSAPWANRGVNILPDPPVALVVAIVESVHAALGPLSS